MLYGIITGFLDASLDIPDQRVIPRLNTKTDGILAGQPPRHKITLFLDEFV